MSDKRSPKKSSSEGSASDSEWPSLDAAGTSASPDSAAEDKKPQPEQSSTGAVPKKRRNNGQNGRKRWQSLPVEVTVRDSSIEFRRDDLPPRFRKQQYHHNLPVHAEGSEYHQPGPSTQLVPTAPPIPPPVAPYRQDVTPACQPDQQAQSSSSSFNGTLPRAAGPTYPRRPVPVPFTDARQQRLFFIRKQVEHYFKPHLLARDGFLIRHMDSDSFMPISLIANFSKVKELTKELELLVEAIKTSDVLEVRDYKVRRRNWTRPTGKEFHLAHPSWISYPQNTNGNLGGFDFVSVPPPAMAFSRPPTSYIAHYHPVSSVYYPPGMYATPIVFSGVSAQAQNIENFEAGGVPRMALPYPPGTSHQ